MITFLNVIKFNQKRHHLSKNKIGTDVTSRFDPNRKTTGAIYLEAAKNNTDSYVIAGDMSHEMTKSLVDDLNDTIASNPFDGIDFYITVYEKKDLQMKRALLRRLYVTKYRPYPEDDTIVFHVYPKSNHIDYCWCLPHSSEMDNILMTAISYHKDFINDIMAWKDPNYDKCLKHFGFERIGKQIVPSLENRDTPMNYSKISIAV